QAIGIDLGTTFSCAAFVKSDSTVDVITNHYGNKITPSVVHFGITFKEVGEEAQAKRGSDPQNTVFQIKRFMGRAVDDAEIRKRPYPFEVLRLVASYLMEKSGERSESKIYCPEQISSFILRYLKNFEALSVDEIGTEVKDAVITVPANFSNSQRQATKDAGEMAGLNVLRIINEPTAAALAYGFGLNSDTEKIVLIYDLGGGTFDVSIVRSKGLESDVLSTSGLTDLGGEDFDRRLFEHASAQFEGRGIKIRADEEFGLYRSCEEAKKTLSFSEQATIELFQNGTRFACDITRSKFEDLCIDLFEKTIECVEDAIIEAKVDKKSIDDIVLVGGSSRIPKVQQMVRDCFGDRELKFNIPPDHAVACGAAILERSAAPASSAPLSSVRGSIRLADVLPFSLGTDISYGRCDTILRRNTPYPVSNTKGYNNSKDNLKLLRFQILEGESALSAENRLLGVCNLPIQPMPVGENKVEGTYSVDENGILNVLARDKHTGEEVFTKVQTSRLTDEERMKMIRNAKKEAEMEEIERAKYEARSAFADAIHSVRRAVHKTNSAEKKAELAKLVDVEEKWMSDQKNVSNEDLIGRSLTINAKLIRIMQR
ncbi:hypothetical protein PMAYCL1PPCAC_03196, partial [Pristionchus mayeri]